jgi:hypothetical protein
MSRSVLLAGSQRHSSARAKARPALGLAAGSELLGHLEQVVNCYLGSYLKSKYAESKSLGFQSKHLI